MEIRRAHPFEAEQLTFIAQASKRYWNYPEKWLELWADALTITSDFIFWNEVFVAVDGDAIFGFYALTSEPGKLTLEHLWVDPAHIGIVSDPNAEEFYRKMGARRVGEEIIRIEGTRRVLPRLRIEVNNLERFEI